MDILTSLITSTPSLNFPAGLAGWTGLFILAAVTLALLWRWRAYNRPIQGRSWLWLVLLALATPLTSLILGLSLPVESLLTAPGVAEETPERFAMLLSAVPAAKKKNHAPRSACFPYATNTASGIPKTSGPNYGSFSIQLLTRRKPFASFPSAIGQRSISGTI